MIKDTWETKDDFDENLTEMQEPGEYGPPPLTDDSDCEGEEKEEDFLPPPRPPYVS